jgi:hypothetical protein
VAERPERVDRQRLDERVLQKCLEARKALAGVGFANWLRCLIVGLAAWTATLPVSEAWPSDLIAGNADFENAGRSRSSVLKFLAAELRLASTGSLASAAAPSLAIAGFSCSSSPGRRWIDTRRLESCADVSRAVLPASTMNRLTCLELLASAVTTELESAVSC